ncbi:MAG: PAS domain S-box protein, partial [Ignavibacteriaceae bacterium]|nr:PAS domain S-box protein [Ignavibacteriaceae bacterium]
NSRKKTQNLSLRAVAIKSGRNKLIECNFDEIKTKSKRTTQSKNHYSEINQLSEIEEIKQTNQKLKTIFQNNPLLIFIVDKDGIIKEVNSLGAKELGYQINELLNQPVTKVFLPEDWKIVNDQIHECVKNPGKMFNWEIKKIRKNDEVIWVKENACTIEANGKNPEVLIVCDNITKIKQAEKSLQESAKKIRQIVDASPYGVHVYDLKENGDLIFTGYNSAANKILGIDHSYLLNKKIEKAFPNLIKTEIPAIYKHIAKTGNHIENKVVEYEDNKVKGAFDVSAIQIEPGKIAAFFSDITEKRKASEELEKSELKFKSLFELANDAIFLMDSDIFIDCNKKTLEMFACNKEEIVGRPPYEFSPEKQSDGRFSKEKALEKINSALSGNPQRFEWKHKKKNGDLFDTDVSLNRIVLGNKVVLQAIVRDITERKKAEEQISILAHSLKSIYESVCITDIKGNIIFVNNSFCQTFDYEYEKIIGKHFSIIVSESNPANLRNEILPSILKDGWKGEVTCKRKDRTEFLSYLSTSIIRNDQGTPSALIAILADITERKKSEEALIESEERFRSLIDNMIETALILDWNGKIIFANKSAVRLVGLNDLAEGIGKSVFDFLHPDFIEKVTQAIDRIKSDPTPLIDEYKIRTVTDEELWVESLGITINLSNEKYLLVTLRDVTMRKNAETQLMEAKEKAEEMSRIKSIFLANISHELRTPLVGILGFAELLKEQLKINHNIEMADRILTSANRLMETLNLLLDLSRIEARKVDLNIQPYRISELVESQILLFEAVAERKNLYLNTIVNDQNLLSLVDEQIFRQIINNLINNALKYTYTGGVTVIVDSVKEDSKSFVQVKVKDTGIGIPQESLGLIFQEFRQVSEGFNRHFEGTGLGLTITKNFVESMNGQIAVTSTVGSGSTFTILFPLIENYQEVEIPKLIEVSSLSTDEKELTLDFKPKVLIVENDNASIDIIRLFLKDLCVVEFVDSGEKAYKLINENDYDLILMDINLGKGMSGTETTKEIRKIEKYKNIPIVAITGFAMRGDREEFLKAGCTHYLSKPFSRAKIIKLIKQIFAKEEV